MDANNTICYSRLFAADSFLDQFCVAFPFDPGGVVSAEASIETGEAVVGGGVGGVEFGCALEFARCVGVLLGSVEDKA